MTKMRRGKARGGDGGRKGVYVREAIEYYYSFRVASLTPATTFQNLKM